MKGQETFVGGNRVLIPPQALIASALLPLAHLGLAVDDIELGHDDAARAEAAEALRLNPHGRFVNSAGDQRPRGGSPAS